MGKAIEFEVDGLDDVKKSLTDLIPKEAKAILRRTMGGLAADIRDDARRRAPERRRVLKKAIKSKRDRGTKTSFESSVRVTHGRGVRNDAFYWHMVEWGTFRTSTKPFLTPAFVRGRANFSKFFQFFS